MRVSRLIAIVFVAALLLPASGAGARVHKRPLSGAAVDPTSIDQLRELAASMARLHVLPVIRLALPRLLPSSVLPPSEQVSGFRLDILPVLGELSSSFGYRRDPLRRHRRQLHKGIDIAAPRGTAVRAAGSGTVVRAGYARGYGRIVVIDHGDGLESWYAHLHRIKVRRGQTLEVGDLIATVGSSGRSTGPHLHFEVRENGVAIDPIRELPLLVRLAIAF